MACQNCSKLKGDWTSKSDEFDQTFHVLTSIESGLVSSGVAECKSCRQKVDFEFDYTLIPKLRVYFLEE